MLLRETQPDVQLNGETAVQSELPPPPTVVQSAVRYTPPSFPKNTDLFVVLLKPGGETMT